MLNVFGQPGSRDYSFIFSDTSVGNYLTYYSIQKQFDNKILCIVKNGINFEVCLKRFYENGIQDYTFNSIVLCNPGGNVIYWPELLYNDLEIIRYKVLSNNKIIVSTLNISDNSKKIIRLNENGDIDTTFNERLVSTFIQNEENVENIEIDSHENLYYFSDFGFGTSPIVKLLPNGEEDTIFSENFFYFTTFLLDNSLNLSDIKICSDNNLYIGSKNTTGNSNFSLFKMDTLGNLLNSYDIAIEGLNYIEIQDIALQSDGKILLGGSFRDTAQGTNYFGMLRLNLDGSWDQSFQRYSRSDVSYFDNVNIAVQEDNKIIFNYQRYDDTLNVLRFNSNGYLDTTTSFSEKCSRVSTISIIDFKLYITTHLGTINEPSIYRLKLKEYAKGKVFNDYNQNCYVNTNDFDVTNVSLKIQPGDYIVQTYPNGNWYYDSLQAGDYTITIDTTNTNWTFTCPITQSFTVVHPDSVTIAPSFGLISNNPCPEPTISIYMPFMRPCFTNQQIYIEACNENNATDFLPDAYSIVELDSNLIFENASIPFTSLGDNHYRFDHDTLFPGECVNYTISAQVACDAILGQTFCMEANLYPVADCVLDSIPTPPTGEVSPCTLPWDKSSLRVGGWCANDSIYFTITNTGEFDEGDMECYSPVRIFVDGLLIQLDSILLQGGETFTYVFLGTGQTWILQADQHPLHPGNSHPNAHVENCNPGFWTPDLVNNLPLDDADPVVDIYCGVVTGSYDPNDKRGFPNGISDDHFIAKNQDLEYIIRFQNTGTDTAFTVVVRDTLDENFNIFTVTPGVSSHPYSFRMYGPRILEWSFYNILLPDSTTNEPLSNGFLTFSVKQNPDLVEGTILRNNADIYFDFNSPIITNETEHKISYQINNLASLEKLKSQKNSLKLYPNPSNSSITIDLKTFSKNVNYKIYALSGKLLQEKNNSYGHKISIDIKNLENGIYFIELEYDSKIEVLNFVKN